MFESVPKPTLKVLSERFGIGKSNVGDIIKKRDSYKEQYEKNASRKKEI